MRQATPHDMGLAQIMARDGTPDLFDLLGKVNFGPWSSVLCELGAQHGHTDVVQWFIDNKPSLIKDQSLHTAIYHGQINVVPLVVHFLDPDAITQGLMYTVFNHQDVNKNRQVVDILAPLITQQTLDTILERRPEAFVTDVFQYAKARLNAAQQKQTLLDALPTDQGTSPKSKM